MRTRILLLIAIALLGLGAVVAVAGVNLQRIGEEIRRQQETTSVLNDLGNEAKARTIGLRLRVEALFAVSTPADLQAGITLLNTDIGDLGVVLARFKEPGFAPALSLTIDDGRTLSLVADSLVTGMAGLDNAGKVAGTLAGDHIALRAKVGPAKDALSKAFRACLDLQTIDPKAFNVLTRGVITTMSTDSGRDVKFAGNSKYEEGVATFSKATLSPGQRTALDGLIAAYVPAYDLIREQLAATNDSAAFTRAADTQIADIELLQGHLSKAFAQGQSDLVARSRATLRTTLWLAGGIALLSLLSGLYMARLMTRRLAQGVSAIEGVREALTHGDLTARVGLSGHDEIATIGAAVDGTVSKLQAVMTDISGLATGIVTGSSTLEQASGQLSGHAADTARQATALGGSVDHVRGGVESAATTAQGFALGVQQIADSATQAADLAHEAVGVVDQSNQAMQRLEKSSNEIGDILKIITEITEQTQLLALNAAIEAASAGAAGRGFAVVANEVKALAARTATAAVEIQSRTKAIQRDSSEAGGAIASVGDLIKRISAGQGSIAQAAKTQADATTTVSGHLGEAVSGTNQAVTFANTLQTVAADANRAASQVAETTGTLADGAGKLQAFVATYRI